MTTCQRTLDNVFDNFRTKCAILMKFCTSEQNLITNILKINLSPQLTPNEIVYGKKYWNKFRYSCICRNDCEESRILRKLCLTKTKRSMFRSHHKFYFFLTPSFAAAMFLFLVCEYCPSPDNNLSHTLQFL